MSQIFRPTAAPALGALSLLLFNSFVVSAAPSPEDPTPTPPGVYPITEDPFKLRIGYEQTNSPTLSKDYVHWYEEKTNIEVQHLNLDLIRLSGDTLPDVILTDPHRYCQGDYGKDLISLNEYVDRYGLYIHNVYDAVPEVLDACATPDGKVYSLPIYDTCLTCRYNRNALINTSFVKALGLNLPSTVLEFEEYLRAVKNEDPNNNQEPDEIPYTGAVFRHSAIDDFLLSPFVSNERRYGYYLIIDENDKLTPAFIDDTWKEGLRWIARLYGEGLIDANAFSLEWGSLVTQDVSVVGAYSEDAPLMRSAELGPIQRLPQLASYRPQKNARGDNSYALLQPSISAVIPNTSSVPEVAFRWLDGFYESDAISYAEWGAKGQAAPTASARDNAVPALVVSRGEFSLGVNGVFPFNSLGDLERTSLDTELLRLQETIKRYVDEYTLEFVTGSRDLDDEWDSYVEGVRELGLNRFVELNQYLYDGIKRSIGPTR